MVQLSHLYLTTGKAVALIKWIFVSKVMSLLFNMLSRFVITFLPRNKHPLISWLWSLSAVILEPKKVKSVTDSTFPPSVCHEVMGPDASGLAKKGWIFCIILEVLRLMLSEVAAPWDHSCTSQSSYIFMPHHLGCVALVLLLPRRVCECTCSVIPDSLRPHGL